MTVQDWDNEFFNERDYPRRESFVTLYQQFRGKAIPSLQDMKSDVKFEFGQYFPRFNIAREGDSP